MRVGTGVGAGSVRNVGRILPGSLAYRCDTILGTDSTHWYKTPNKRWADGTAPGGDLSGGGLTKNMWFLIPRDENPRKPTKSHQIPPKTTYFWLA